MVLAWQVNPLQTTLSKASSSLLHGVKLATGYEMQTIDFDDETADVDAAAVPVMVMWNINPNFDVWAEARFDAGTDDDDPNTANYVNFDEYAGTNYAENVFSLGLRYNF